MTGIELSERFFVELVRPALARDFPSVLASASAAIIGDGSEVLGFDDDISHDHNFSPRVVLLLDDDGFDAVGPAVADSMETALPAEFAGCALHWSEYRRAVEVAPLVRHFCRWLNRPALPATSLDWLRCSEQRLLELTAGKVFADPTGRLTALRSRLAGYPPEVRLFLLRLAFVRLSECAGAERAIRRDDPVAISHCVNWLTYFAVRAGHLLEQRYCPYPKWQGRSLAGLGPFGRELHGRLVALLTASTGSARRDGMLAVLGLLGRRLLDELGNPERPSEPESLTLLDFDWQAVLARLSARLPEELKDLSPLVSPPEYLGPVFDYTGYEATYEDLLAANLSFQRGTRY